MYFIWGSYNNSLVSRISLLIRFGGLKIQLKSIIKQDRGLAGNDGRKETWEIKLRLEILKEEHQWGSDEESHKMKKEIFNAVIKILAEIFNKCLYWARHYLKWFLFHLLIILTWK